MDNLKDYMTIKEAAQYLGVSTDTLRRWDRSGKVRAIRHPVNRYRLYVREELADVLKDLRQQAKNPAKRGLPGSG